MPKSTEEILKELATSDVNPDIVKMFSEEEQKEYMRLVQKIVDMFIEEGVTVGIGYYVLVTLADSVLASMLYNEI